MVFESLVNPWKAETHPGVLFFYGFLYASIGLFLSHWIFEEHASLIMVFLTTMAAVPLVYNIIKMEEKKDLGNLNERNLLREHSKALLVFMYYFLGATIGFAFWYAILPTSTLTTSFEVQAKTIVNIRSNVTGNSYLSFRAFSQILSNNLKVLIFCILFSFLYGLGAIFILTWNASVIGVAIGDTIRTGFYKVGNKLNLGFTHVYLGTITQGLFRYSIHGIPEILAYFVAGLAGGIISTAAIRHDFGTKRYINIVFDSSILLILSLILIVFAAWLEVYITPLVF
jgi:uncharacterized membrane protein SpoIIM required for sporulation